MCHMALKAEVVVVDNAGRQVPHIRFANGCPADTARIEVVSVLFGTGEIDTDESHGYALWQTVVGIAAR